MFLKTLLLNTVDYVGMALMRYIYLLTSMVELSWRAHTSVLRGNTNAVLVMRETLQQVYFTAIQSLGIITVLALFSGSVVLIQATAQFTLFAGYEMLGQFLVLTIVREGAPLLTAMVVIARSSTAVTAHLGNMRLNGEINLLKSIGVNPYAYVVFPRIVGGTMGLSALAFYFAVVAVIGGYIMTSFLHELSPVYYSTLLLDSLGEFEGWFLFIFKVTCDGLFIFTIACFFGLNVQRDYVEVARATTQAVMRCLTYVLVFNITASIVFYTIQLNSSGAL